MTDKEFVVDSFCAWAGDTMVLNILGKPGSNRDAIGKVKGKQLKVRVTASPVAGRASDHLVRFLAEEFGVSIKDIKVVLGRFNVNKQLRIRLGPHSGVNRPRHIGRVDYKSSPALLRREQHQIEYGLGRSALRIMLGNQGSEPLGGYADMNVGRAAEITRRKIAFKPVGARCIGEQRGPVLIVVFFVGSCQPELDLRSLYRRAVPG